MAKLDEEIRQLKARIEAARNARMQAEAERIAAQRALDQAREMLDKEFGVTTLEQAQELLSYLEDQAASELEKVEQHLAAAEAAQ